ncbi:efflux RND transporter periplasmic adaptor subunit [Thiovibrio frasassiensis]|jgi:HlyD family secretion protein|uniref:Efflux RND transporter periplasmic adaptor subunit n=1 Tax=Thiovibrio frasassiensis TaxID=2984131 RepID=A0A9X4RLI2_9BACT|nr:efflux RND transporter periplasmic adaptor subunit [Thiovibrio frasassiensis]MDG4475163.1 efflux RND transporter periplasmic adaptor subunit [Thiovibrio frasassiensis]
MKHPAKKALIILIAALLLGSLATWQLTRSKAKNGAGYRTAELTRGDLLVTISATGTVEPEEVIDVGAQVAGRIVSFGKDAHDKTVDYGSLVEAGTVLARIDDSLYAADVTQAEAQLMSNKAGLQKAKADLNQAELNWKRAQLLGSSQALSQSAYESYESAHTTALAQVAVSEASIRQGEAALARARRNLGYCTITSPVKGIIIDRRVNTGQTVVASLNAPSLFLLAKDLTRIQVWVAVNEADIGRIQPGQPVTFTVDAFPNETFTGEVGKIRLNASMTQNVVTYTVEITTDNTDGRLLPYLTANVLFQLQQVRDVLQAPNAALRWSPPAWEGEAEPGKKKSGIKESKKASSAPEPGKKSGSLWVLDKDRKPRRIAVLTGASDGTNTVVESMELREGMQVITGIRISETEKSAGGSPFTPQFARGNKAKAEK